MKFAAVLICLAALTGCANIELIHDNRYGYKPYDPCIRCGEKWDQLPNERFEAQRRRQRGERW